MLFFGLASGIIAGSILLLVAHMAPYFGAENVIQDIDRPTLFGNALTRRESHLLGALVHLAASALFGLEYAFLVQMRVFDDVSLISILGWGVVFALFVGGVLLPLEGHGLFGVKEDAWFPVDLFLTSVLWSVVFWWLMKLWYAYPSSL